MFTDSGLSDEMAEKIVAFVDREAGRDAPLTVDDEAAVRRLIQDDPTVRALVDELRATNAGLDTLLDDVAAVEVPANLEALIRGYGTDHVAIAQPADGDDRMEDADEALEDGEVVAFRRPTARRFSYGALAAAASIALLISCGALYRLYTTFEAERGRLEAALASASDNSSAQGRELAEAKAELNRLASLAEQASGRNQETAEALAANEDAVQQLEVERANLQGRFAALEEENQRLSVRAQEQRAALANSAATRDRTATELADARQALIDAESQVADVRDTLSARVDDLTAELGERDQEMASLTQTLQAREQQSESAGLDLARIRDARADLQRRLADAETDKRELLAARTAAEENAGQAERRLAAMAANVRDAESRLATVAAGLASAEAGRREAVQQVFGLEADLAASTSWLGQISQYHRIYASTARRHLVEVGADELGHIQQWLTGMLGRDIVVPDLTNLGVTFAGARLLGVNEKPVAQLIYLDADDQPLALCIIPSSGGAKAATPSTNRDLNLVDWRDGRYGYAVVGWSDPALLSSLAEAIQPIYDL